MDFKWIQLRSEVGELEKWGLFHKDTKRIVVLIHLSNHGSVKENAKIRQRIKASFCKYYNKVLFDTLRFFE